VCGSGWFSLRFQQKINPFVSHFQGDLAYKDRFGTEGYAKIAKSSACEPVNVGEVLGKIYLLVRDECERRGIRIGLEVDGNDLVVESEDGKGTTVTISLPASGNL
jgi:hypothetical protein